MAEDDAFSDAIHRDVHRLRPWREPPGDFPALDRRLPDRRVFALAERDHAAMIAVVEVGGAGR